MAPEIAYCQQNINMQYRNVQLKYIEHEIYIFGYKTHIHVASLESNAWKTQLFSHGPLYQICTYGETEFSIINAFTMIANLCILNRIS